MTQVADVTGQSRLLAEIHRVLWAQDRPAIRICGPSGSGKSWIAQRTADWWQDEGDVAFVAPGDELFSRRPHFPLLLAVSSEIGSAHTKAVTRLAIEPVSVIPFGGKPLREMLLHLVERSDAETATRTPYLRPDDREILLRMQRAAASRRVLLICDNLQWWDEPSLELLGLLRSPAARTAFPFLENLAVMALETTDAPIEESPSRRTLAAASPWVAFDLPLCPGDSFSALLRAFGVRSALPPDVVAHLFAITGGHLELVRRIAEADAGAAETHLWDTAQSRADFLFRLLEQRLERSTTLPEETATVLRAASVIGTSFAVHELTCMLKDEPRHLAQLLEPAERLRILERSGRVRMFVHDLVHRYFLQHAKTRRADLHERFSECLRLVHSGDYARRAEHLRRSSNHQSAGEVLVLDALQRARAGAPPLLEALRSDLAIDLVRLVTTMVNAQAEFDSGEYHRAIHALEGIEPLYPDALLAERDILLARSHIKLLTRADRTQAKAILSRWDRLRDSESEIWGRVMLYLTVANVFLGDEEGAKEAERALYQNLASRVGFDPTARVTVNHLRLKSDMLHSAHVARERLREAIEFFSGSANAATYDPVHQCIGLANLAANHLAEGEFDEAFSVCQQANALLERERAVTFGRPDILLTNLTLAAYLSGRLTASDALDAAQVLLGAAGGSNDAPLLATNVAFYLARERRYDEAIALLAPVFQKLVDRTDFDTYYPYYVGNNLSGSLYMQGRVAEGRSVWETITPYLQDFIGPLAPYLRRRHGLQTGIFGAELAAHDWDAYLGVAGTPQVGPGWKLYGKGFLPSELEFWSDE
jgi:tetratricopeptide (TPR) repeat protein